METVRFYKVGGCVRDAILGVKSKDIDYSVEAPSFDAMRQEIVKRGGEVFLETPQYLTIRAKVPNLGAADFVLCRKDGAYSDGRRPDEVIPGTLHDDLSRRDFTMNAIAQDEDGTLVDPFNGQDAIDKKLIVCVGDAEDRFGEDYLRLLRAMRFSITKGFRLDISIVKCLDSSVFAHGLMKVSIERVREECLKAFMFDTVKTLDFFTRFPYIRRVVFEKMGLRLKPTLEQ